MIGIAVNLLDELRHDSQLSRVPTELNVEVDHVVRRAIPPVSRVIGEVVSVVNDRPFPVLGTGGSVKIEAVQPNAGAVQHFTSMQLIQWFGCVR